MGKKLTEVLVIRFIWVWLWWRSGENTDVDALHDEVPGILQQAYHFPLLSGGVQEWRASSGRHPTRSPVLKTAEFIPAFCIYSFNIEINLYTSNYSCIFWSRFEIFVNYVYSVFKSIPLFELPFIYFPPPPPTIFFSFLWNIQVKCYITIKHDISENSNDISWCTV